LGDPRLTELRRGFLWRHFGGVAAAVLKVSEASILLIATGNALTYFELAGTRLRYGTPAS
jgi:hypothetical protein